MPAIWAGMDISREHHYCVVIDAQGKRLLSRRVLNGQADLTALNEDVLAIAPDVQWVVDVNHGSRPADRVAGVQGAAGVYLTGLAVHRASATTEARARPTPRTPM